MFFASSAVVALGLASSAYAAIFFTSPTAAIGFAGGVAANITWDDDGTAPSLLDFGLAKASIYAGNAAQQTSLQTISASINVSSPLFLSFIPDPTIGPSGTEYFVRFDSLSLTDTSTNPPIPALAFSHIFTLTNMTGTFSAAVQSEIDGQSTAPIGGSASTTATGATGASSTGAKAASTTVATTKAATSSGSVTAKAAAASGSSAAVPSFVAGSQKLWLGIVTGVFGAAMGAALL